MTSLRVLCLTALVWACCLLSSPALAAVTYTHADGLNALYYAKAACCDAYSIETWTCGMTCKQHNNFRVSSVIRNGDLNLQSYVGIDDASRQVVVAFRGASDGWNMAGSSAALMASYDNAGDCGADCKVHVVLQLYYRELQFYIRRYVIGALQWNPSYSVLVTGHSMGGGLAQLAATDLQTQINRYGFSPRPVVHLYTFGALRVGNSDYAQWAASVLSNGAHFHVTHANDPVPRMPPRSILRYIHVPQEIFYPTDAVTFTACVDSYAAEDPNCSCDRQDTNTDDHMFYLGINTGC